MTEADTSGFYRIDEGVLQHAPNRVHAPTYTLLRADKDSYSAPLPGGWVWADSREEACTALGWEDPPEENGEGKP